MAIYICAECKGTGEIDGIKCWQCLGTGERELDVEEESGDEV